MIALSEVRRKAAEAGLGIEVIERDYVLSWLLWGLFTHPSFRELAVFKGGTALRKAYFPDYRFSQDVDVTLVDSVATEALQAMLDEACRATAAESGMEFSVARFQLERDEAGGEAYSARIAYVGPRRQQREPARLKVDLTRYETLVLGARDRPMLHPYSDACVVTLPTYALEEMLAEKLRAMLTRRRVRHFYDVWNLLRYRSDQFDPTSVRRVFVEKCRYKRVAFHSPADFFRPEALEVYAASWDKSLSHQVGHLPAFATAATECREFVQRLFEDRLR